MVTYRTLINSLLASRDYDEIRTLLETLLESITEQLGRLNETHVITMNRGGDWMVYTREPTLVGITVQKHNSNAEITVGTHVQGFPLFGNPLDDHTVSGQGCIELESLTLHHHIDDILNESLHVLQDTLVVTQKRIKLQELFTLRGDTDLYGNPDAARDIATTAGVYIRVDLNDFEYDLNDKGNTNEYKSSFV
jgi:hypothetical protein